MALSEVDVNELDLNPFTSIGDEWMLITAGDEQSHNTMTASWGSLGVIWGKPSATCYIRQSRYTKQFVDNNELFTLSFYGVVQYRKALTHLGTVSGRDEDKIAAVGFTPVAVDGTTTFAEAKLTLVCRKRSETFIDPKGFIDLEVDSKWYGDKDYHTMYIASIEHAYVAE